MHILAIDQGTTSSRAILFNEKLEKISVGQLAFKQYYPNAAWVEHDPEEIWKSTLLSIFECIDNSGSSVDDIDCIGITNQRETTILWDKRTGEAIHPAIVWQDRRTADLCNQLKEAGYGEGIQERTGLILDAYFSATKIQYILNEVPEARSLAQEGHLAFGTVDSWLVWKLTGGKVHATDVTNASRTMLYNINELKWDESLLDLFDIPASILPEVFDSSAHVGNTDPDLLGNSIPICSMIGDQQSALFGQGCFNEGDVKNTYGTGCFIMLNTGESMIHSRHNMLSTLAWKIGDECKYAIEGSVFVAGAVVQWLIDELGLFSNLEDMLASVHEVQDTDGVVFVPALTGLAAPYWDPSARGTLLGITRGTKKGHIAAAALEGIVFQVNDVLQSMKKDLGRDIPSMKVDGGISVNKALMQFQANISNMDIEKPIYQESTALGAAMLAGLARGIWDRKTLADLLQIDERLSPTYSEEERAEKTNAWKKAVNRALEWA